MRTLLNRNDSYFLTRRDPVISVALKTIRFSPGVNVLGHIEGALHRTEVPRNAEATRCSPQYVEELRPFVSL
jgi:hypothetical protein